MDRPRKYRRRYDRRFEWRHRNQRPWSRSRSPRRSPSHDRSPGAYTRWRNPRLHTDSSDLGRMASRDTSFQGLSEGSSTDSSMPFVPLSPPSSHDTSRAGFHHEDLKAFADELNDAARSAFPNSHSPGYSRYKTVTVFLIRWEDDDSFAGELEQLKFTFERYGFTTNVWLIPSANPLRFLMRKALDFVETQDDGQNLLILYYAGHGRINRERKAEWVCHQKPDSPFVDWSAIQGLFTTAKSNILLLLDTCAAASSVTTMPCEMMEVIAACGFESRAAPPGEHSFTNSLIEVLGDWINRQSFSAAQLHAEILFRLKQKENKKGREGIRFEWCSTPVYCRSSTDHKSPGIELYRRCVSQRSSPYPSFEDNRECSRSTFIDRSQIDFDNSNTSRTVVSSLGPDGRYKVPHVLIRLQLEEDQHLDAKTCADWLKKVPLLTKWATVESVHSSFSTLLLLSVPVPIWDMLPDHPAWSFVGYVTAPSCIPPRPWDKPDSTVVVDVSESAVEPTCGTLHQNQTIKDEVHILDQQPATFLEPLSEDVRVPLSPKSDVSNISSVPELETVSQDFCRHKSFRDSALGTASTIATTGRAPTTTTSPCQPNIEVQDGEFSPIAYSFASSIHDDYNRSPVHHIEVPSLKEQEHHRLLEQKNLDIEEWTEKHDAEGDFSVPHKHSFFDTTKDDIVPSDSASVRTARENEQDLNVTPVDDAASVRENRITSGIYYKAESQLAQGLTEADLKLIVGRQWNDAPTVKNMTQTSYQPATSNDAIRRWIGSADNVSVVSRAATWGTRRLSDVDLQDVVAVTGNLLERIASNSKTDGISRRTSIFDNGLDRISSIVRSRSVSKLKRHHSSYVHSETNVPERSLSTPTHLRKSSFPRLNTAVAVMSGPLAAVGSPHVGSVTAGPSSPKPPHFSFAKSVINRVRSKSSPRPAESTELGELWRNLAGSAAPVLVSSPLQSNCQITEAPIPKDENPDTSDEDSSDQPLTSLDLHKLSRQISPTIQGFTDHIKRLNPGMDVQHFWLVDRIAKQLLLRYRELLDAKIKHSNSGKMNYQVVSLSGDGQPTNSKNAANYREVSGAINPDCFPTGVPMPPVNILPAEIECQLCFKRKNIYEPLDWTKHVYEDLTTYVCTFRECRAGMIFKRKVEWVLHENLLHRRLEWWTCPYDECGSTFIRKDKFVYHLVDRHKLQKPNQGTHCLVDHDQDSVVQLTEKAHRVTTSRSEDEPCKFCGKTFKTWGKLTDHLATHMEMISLSIIPLVEAKEATPGVVTSPDISSMPLLPIPVFELDSVPVFELDVANISKSPARDGLSSSGSSLLNSTNPYLRVPSLTTSSSWTESTHGLSPEASDHSYISPRLRYGSIDSGLSPSMTVDPYLPFAMSNADCLIKPWLSPEIIEEKDQEILRLRTELESLKLQLREVRRDLTSPVRFSGD